MRVLCDTSFLLRLRDTSSPAHPDCISAFAKLHKQGATLYICAQVLIEYWVVATRPRQVNGFGLSPVDVEQDFEDFQQAFTVLPEPPDIAARWQQLVQAHSVLGRQAHDARLVTVMQAHGITHILTLNPKDFLRYQSLTVLKPDQI